MTLLAVSMFPQKHHPRQIQLLTDHLQLVEWLRSLPISNCTFLLLLWFFVPTDP